MFLRLMEETTMRDGDYGGGNEKDGLRQEDPQ
jgi:hypothetical protein